MTNQFNFSIYYYYKYYAYTYFLYGCIILYLPIIFYIKNKMINKQPLKSYFWNNLLGLWNIFLGISSFYGGYLLVPFLYNDIKNNGLIKSICCGSINYNELTSNVVMLFNFSKFLEFIDTLFIVLRKSQLEFLHYYHHITTCIYCWWSGYLFISNGSHFAAINLIVHSIMYTYYALVAFNINFLYPYRKLITIIQTLQMLLGIFIILIWFNNCSSIYNNTHILNQLFGLFMYISYGYLFSKLLFRYKSKQLE